MKNKLDFLNKNGFIEDRRISVLNETNLYNIIFSRKQNFIRCNNIIYISHQFVTNYLNL